MKKYITHSDFSLLLQKSTYLKYFKDIQVGSDRRCLLKKHILHLDNFISNIINDIQNDSYVVDDYNNFFLREKGKKREISAPSMKEVWVQRVLYNIMYPVFERKFIHESHGCRIGKGVHSAILSAQNFLRTSDKSSKYLKLDIKKYFYAIDHTILYDILSRTIRDEKFLSLVAKYFKSPKNDYYDVNTRGVPLGNLLSQLFGLIYMNETDQFIKRKLGIKKYIRYVDDFILFDLKDPETIKAQVEDFLLQKLNLTLSKCKIGNRTLKFLGFKITPNTLKQNSIVYKQAVEKDYQSSQSGLIHLGIKTKTDYNLNYKMNLRLYNNFINSRTHLPLEQRKSLML